MASNPPGISPEEYFKTPVRTLIKQRAPWLVLGLTGGIFAAQIIGFFEQTLETQLILAAFIPLITYMADAIAAETEIIFVRSIALSPRINAKKFLSKELKIGFGVALISSTLIAIYSFIRYQTPYLGLVLGISISAATLIAITIGTIVPWLFYKFRRDPALATGPLTTILQDVISVTIYFLVASWLL
ncbi:MAG: magnesium transporter [Candidatus Colwellbacteria bacterium]|nr:magnesium transporter [Candidatus Colwellbacteria bacterium]